jgi:hypothetical protein
LGTYLLPPSPSTPCTKLEYDICIYHMKPAHKVEWANGQAALATAACMHQRGRRLPQHPQPLVTAAVRSTGTHVLTAVNKHQVICCQCLNGQSVQHIQGLVGAACLA